MSPKPKSRITSSPAPSRGFDKELAELESLSEAFKSGSAPTTPQIEHLRKILAHRNNFLVSKAAKLVAEAELTALLPDVLSAYDRFFIDPPKPTPNAGPRKPRQGAGQARPSQQGRLPARHAPSPDGSQLGPPVDTAGALRGTCTHALVDCPGISDADLLTALLEPLTDTDKTVRMEAARAIGQVGGVSAALILRLRALLGSQIQRTANRKSWAQSSPRCSTSKARRPFLSLPPHSKAATTPPPKPPSPSPARAPLKLSPAPCPFPRRRRRLVRRSPPQRHRPHPPAGSSRLSHRRHRPRLPRSSRRH